MTAADDDAEVELLRGLMRRGEFVEVVRAADGVVARAPGATTAGRALLFKLAALINKGDRQACPAVLDEAFRVVGQAEDEALQAELHVLAADLARGQGSLDRCASHLVLAQRILDNVDRCDVHVAYTLLDLAVGYSYAGLHEQAVAASERCRAVARAAGLQIGPYQWPEIPLRMALALDHEGDSEGCARLLRRLVAEMPADDSLPRIEWKYRIYASVRLAALGLGDVLEELPDSGLYAAWEGDDLRGLIAAATAIVDGRPADALAGLDRIQVDPRTVGSAEPDRLRALAYARAGDHRAAHDADRRAFRLAAADAARMRGRFVAGVAAQLDQDNLRRAVARYASEALTDPLTGLPNRRHLQQQLAGLTNGARAAVLGVLDVDRFKQINTRHGHQGGDLVLCRVAELIAGVLRRGDFLARFGGDEFVAVLPAATLVEARAIGRRITSVIAAYDWEALVPGTRVSVTLGWAPLRDGLAASFAAADLAMLAAKTRGKPGA